MLSVEEVVAADGARSTNFLLQPPADTELRSAAGREQARAASKTPGPTAALTAPSSAAAPVCGQAEANSQRPFLKKV